MQGKYTFNSLDDVAAVTSQLVSELKSGDVVLLYGELGSGKTTFTQKLAVSLGIQNAITSPTFTVASEYVIPNNKDFQKLIHVDLYRLPEKGAEKDPAVADILEHIGTSGVLVVIEWADRMSAEALAKAERRWQLHFNHGQEQNERNLNISYEV